MGGMFVNGKLNGNGYIFQNGILYTGNFYEGVANGYGTIVYPDRTSWSGIVLNSIATIGAKTFKKKYGGFNCEDTTALCNDYKTLRFLPAQENFEGEYTIDVLLDPDLYCLAIDTCKRFGEDKWEIKYMSDTNGGKYDRAVNGYEFDTVLYETEIPGDVICSSPYLYYQQILLFQNRTGYVYCTNWYKGIVHVCPPGSEVLDDVGGCANKTTNTTIFPVGSRCASNPCGDRGLCSDFPSADGYYCECDPPYTGLNCQTEYRSCPRFACGNRTSKIAPLCLDFASDKALSYVCNCLVEGNSKDKHFALNNCHNEKLFSLKCAGAERVGAVPFTNKAFYICFSSAINASVRSCDLDHVWNDTQKECVPEHTPL
ncbi:unnamed protein product [Adineta steineri]|uniref:EGF-like domain-containing protein n=2 Tax=Adineta steineri TaxID=433720 RepID=A0A814HDG5_9BILA|nr:unnamed protein product [Adineta steineri]